MEFCHRDIDLHSVAAQRLAEFMDKRRQKWATQADASCVDNFESFEHELHSLMMAIERELVSEELGRYKVTVEEIEVDGKAYGRGISLPETYLTSAGRVTIERHLYNPADPKDKSICPMELRSGIIAGYFTPQAARQGAFVMAHLTPGESEEMFGEIGSNVDFENDIFPRQVICNGALCLAFWIFVMIDQVDTTTRIIPMVNAAPRLIIKFRS